MIICGCFFVNSKNEFLKTKTHSLLITQISKRIAEIFGPPFVMLAKAGIQEFYFWIPAGVYPVEKRGRNDGRMRNDFEVNLKSTFLG
jgi:hypothetical protein